MERTDGFLILVCLLVTCVGCSEGSSSDFTSDSGSGDGDTDAELEISLSPADWEEGALEEFSKLQQSLRLGEPLPATSAPNAMISGSSSALAVRSGLEALKKGGSAVDAAITTALAQIALVAGAYVSYAGIFFLTYYDAEDEKVYYLNAGFNAPLDEHDPLTIPGMDSGNPSGRTALVPGFFAGVDAAHERFGTLPFRALFDPAIYFAEEGFEFTDILAYYVDWRKDVLSRLPETLAIFTKENGGFYQAGDWFTQPDLADALKKVAANGASYVYNGDWADRFVAAVQRDGGKITSKDLADYQVIWSTPLTTTFRDYSIYAPGLPSAGGVNTVEALNLLEAAGYPERGDYTSEPEALFWFMQIHRMMLLSYLSPNYLDGLVAGVDLSLESRATKETAAALWQAMERGEFYFSSVPTTPRGTHSDSVVVVDEQGNVAALTHTINCVVWGETGIFVDGVSIPDSAAFQQQKMVDVGPGNRIFEETNPSIVFRDGNPVLASSSIGVTHYRTLPVLYNFMAYDMNAESAFLEPYILMANFDDIVGQGIVERVTDGVFGKSLVAGVRNLGLEVEEIPFEYEADFRGYWIGIEIGAEKSGLTGLTAAYFNGIALGY